MNELFNMLFGLGEAGLRFGDEGVRFVLSRSLAGWVWLFVVAAAVAAAAASYARLTGPAGVRAVLACARVSAVLLLVLMALGPRLVRPVERVEPDRLVMLVDRSRSLTARDWVESVGPDAGVRRSRDEQLAAVLGGAGEALSSLSEQKTLVWVGFDERGLALPAGDGDSVVPALGDADGDATSLEAGLAEALRRVAARPVSGIIVMSDGRSRDAASPASLRQLRGLGVAVHTVGLGDQRPIIDPAIESVEAPAAAFTKDSVTVRVRVALAASGTADVELIDAETGQLLDVRTLNPTEPGAGHDLREVTLRASAEDGGSRRWRVRVRPEGMDFDPENNERTIPIDFVAEPLRVLYIDGYPRWERRYLTTTLLREPSIDAACLLLATDRQFVQESDTPAESVPTTAEEWAEYDVVILGDLRPQLLGDESLRGLAEHVRRDAGGVIWVAGPGVALSAWADTPIGPLLPVQPAAGEPGSPEPTWDVPVALQATSSADFGGALSTPAELDGGLEAWRLIRWVLSIEPGRQKPAAETLATADAGPGRAALPAVVTMRYGAGRATLVGTDETWRWRYPSGTYWTERFWLPLVRYTGRARAERAGRSALFRVSPGRVQTGSTVTLSLDLLDQATIDEAPSRLRVELRPEGQPDAPPVTVELATDGEDGRYSALWTPDRAGSYSATLADPLLGPLVDGRSLMVLAPGDELGELTADHEALRRLSEQTGGRFVDASDASGLSELLRDLPDRRVITLGPSERRELWDRPVWLVVLLVLLGGEWLVRRLIRLS